MEQLKLIRLEEWRFDHRHMNLYFLQTGPNTSHGDDDLWQAEVPPSPFAGDGLGLAL